MSLSAERISPLREKLLNLNWVEGFWKEGSFNSNSGVKQIKVRLLSNGELIETESRTSTGEKQGRLLSEGRAQAPETRALCQTGFQEKKSIE